MQQSTKYAQKHINKSAKSFQKQNQVHQNSQRPISQKFIEQRIFAKNGHCHYKCHGREIVSHIVISEKKTQFYMQDFQLK